MKKTKVKPDARLATLPRYIIKSGKYFINTHTGEVKHQDSIAEWLPKSHQQHDAIMEKRWDLR